MAQVTFLINAPGWIAAFKSWEGPVGVEIAKRTNLVKAKALIEVPHPGGIPRNRTGKNYSTGALLAGIDASFGKWHAPSSSGPGQDLEGRVNSKGKHTAFVIGGTAPHVIVPRSLGGMLVFTGKTGTTVFTKKVNHPGTAPNDYLSRALTAAT
jgi:hypothetical protein